MTTIEIVQESEAIVIVQGAVQIRLKNENGEPERAYAIVVDSNGTPSLEEITN
jgi:hypothetical protein